MRALATISTLVAWLSLSACGPRYEHLVERELAPSDELACPAFLVWNHEPVQDVFLVINGSGTGSSAFVHPTFQEVLGAYPVAYATYDKPGISAPFDDPAAVRRESATLERYTIGHGIACATEAARWAREQFGPSARLHVRAHSEGTLVALYTYDRLLDEDPELAGAFETFVLSGLALEPFDVILERQLDLLASDRIRAATESCDWSELEVLLGISCAYIEDLTRRPSGFAMFERLAARAPSVRFHVFHGTEDWNTPVDAVRELEAWNGAEGHLDIRFRYYAGGHAGNDEVRGEMAELLTSIVSE